jgi:Helix-turn-helix domain
MQPTPTDSPAYYVGHVAPALVQHADLSIGAKMTAVLLLAHRNRGTGLCYPAEETLAAELDISERSVIRYLAELRDAALITWELRKAPRGKARGRGNSYDLTGLLDLCSRPMLKAVEMDDRVTKTVPREVTKTVAHASGNRANEQNSKRLDSIYVSQESCSGSVDCNGTAAVTIEAGEVTKTTPHSARIEQTRAANPHSTVAEMSAEQIQGQRIAPGGEPYDGGEYHSGFNAAREAIEAAGGEPFNPEALSALIDERGEEAVWFQAVWFGPRLAARTTRPDKATAYFISCVRNDYPVKARWVGPPEGRRAKLAEPWALWVSKHRGNIQKVPANLRTEVDALVIATITREWDELECA